MSHRLKRKPSRQWPNKTIWDRNRYMKDMAVWIEMAPNHRHTMVRFQIPTDNMIVYENGQAGVGIPKNWSWI